MWPFDIPRKRREAKERAARHEADLRELRRMAEKEAANIAGVSRAINDRKGMIESAMLRDVGQPMRMRATPSASGTSRPEDRRQQDIGNLRRREDDPIDNTALATGSWLFDPGQSSDSEPPRHSHHCAPSASDYSSSSSASDYGSTSSSSDYSCSSSDSSSSSSDSSSSYSSD